MKGQRKQLPWVRLKGGGDYCYLSRGAFYIFHFGAEALISAPESIQGSICHHPDSKILVPGLSPGYTTFL
ncbi:hypothetical protein [Siccibacter turicensis]|uniref:hypothetical protein n=1 Tax=Siccibacter turicensis TaxID=357233 RepID=UPI002A6B00E4|nr:hypothetical protein [Siccibacter turicensis]MDY0971986.1 hypothetical protein [Siccibacter turicensis]